MTRIIIDMDGVMADTYWKFARAYEGEFGRKLARAELLGKKVYELQGAAHLRNLMHEPGFFRDIDVMAGAREVVRELYERHEVFVVTSCTEFPTAFRDKWAWLREHFAFIDTSRMVFCGVKTVVHGDYMIDDKVANLKGFNGKGLLFSSPDNHYHTGFQRVNTWEEVRTFLTADIAKRSSLASG